MSRENYSNWNHRHENSNGQISKYVTRYVTPSDLEKAGDDLVWAIETVIESPMDIKCWFLVKDAVTKYKTVRRKAQ